MKHGTKYINGLRYKLKAMGIPVEDYAYIYGDNQSVHVNTMTAHSQLKRKSTSVAYHHCQEGFVLDKWRTTYINTHTQ